MSEGASNRIRWNNKAATLAVFAKILGDPLQGRAFDGAWVASVAATVQRQRGVLVGVMTLSFVPTVYLALFLWGKVAETQVFGFKFDDPISLFEVSLLAMTLLGIYGARMAILTAQAEQLINAWLKHRHGDAAMLYAYAYEPPLLDPPRFHHPSDVRPTLGAHGVRIWAQGIFHGFAIVAMSATFITQVAAIIWGALQLLGHNCRPLGDAVQVCDARPPTLAVIGFCAVTTLINVSLYAAYGIKRSFVPANGMTQRQVVADDVGGKDENLVEDV